MKFNVPKICVSKRIYRHGTLSFLSYED